MNNIGDFIKNRIDELITPEVVKFAKTYSWIEALCQRFIHFQFAVEYDLIEVERDFLIDSLKSIAHNTLYIYCKVSSEKRIFKFKVDSSVFLIDNLGYDQLDFKEDTESGDGFYLVSIKQESNQYFEDC